MNSTARDNNEEPQQRVFFFINNKIKFSKFILLHLLFAIDISLKIFNRIDKVYFLV